MRTIRQIKDVVDWGLCIGCGACYSNCDKQGVRLVNYVASGIRPIFSESCATCSKCLAVCPGYEVKSDAGLALEREPDPPESLTGPCLEVWEGCAKDPDIRQQASSGGILTALALFCLERDGVEFVLHSGMKADEPWVNETTQSRTRQDLLAKCGSRYAPSSPCNGLGLIEQAAAPCVFIGKPCDASAVHAARKLKPALDKNLHLVMTFFCAGTPSSKGTLALAEKMGVAPGDIGSIRYRGDGWPGRFRVWRKDGTEAGSLSYEESWGALAKGTRPFRCQLCPDGLGEVADISSGDAWHRHQKDNQNPGLSLILIRSQRGREVFHRAMQEGYIQAQPSSASEVIAAQGLVQRRTQLFGRLLAMQLLLLPTPRYLGFHLFRSWTNVGASMLLRSVGGTLIRLIQRGQWRRAGWAPASPESSPVFPPGCGKMDPALLSRQGGGYVLVTPARNEEATIKVTINSVMAQAVLPKEWVIVSDGSTDRTDEIVKHYAAQCPFIRLIRPDGRSERSFASVVRATETGIAALRYRDYSYIGLLDADVRFGRDYYARLLEKFALDPQLGLGGGFVQDVVNGLVEKGHQDLNQVAGATQFFRRGCFEALGGLVAIPEGGWDALTCVRARMSGYKTSTFTDIRMDHLKRRNASFGHPLRGKWQLGVRDYALASHPLFELAKCVFRARERPFLAGSCARLGGYLWSALSRRKRIMPGDLQKQIRREQWAKLFHSLGWRHGGGPLPVQPAKRDGIRPKSGQQE